MNKLDPFNWTLKELQALQMVVRLGSITAAAARLEVSQPAISRLVASIESKLGVVLFERQGRGLNPTAEAYDFCKKSDAVFEALESMRSGDTTQQGRKQLKITAPPSFASGYLQKTIVHFIKHSEGIDVKLDVNTSTTIIDRLVNGEVDLGITDAAIHHAALQTQPLCTAPLVVYMRKTDPLARQKTVTLTKINSLRIVGLSLHHESRRLIEQALRTARVNYRIIVETSTTQSAIAFVRETGAVAFMSRFPLAESLPKDIVWRPVDVDISYTTRILRPARMGQSVTIKRFIQTLTTQIAKEQTSL